MPRSSMSTANAREIERAAVALLHVGWECIQQKEILIKKEGQNGLSIFIK